MDEIAFHIFIEWFAVTTENYSNSCLCKSNLLNYAMFPILKLWLTWYFLMGPLSKVRLSDHLTFTHDLFKAAALTLLGEYFGAAMKSEALNKLKLRIAKKAHDCLFFWRFCLAPLLVTTATPQMIVTLKWWLYYYVAAQITKIIVLMSEIVVDFYILMWEAPVKMNYLAPHDLK